MAVADTAKLIVDLSLKGNFARQMSANTKALDKFAKGESRAFRAGQQIGTGIKRGAVIAAAGVGILALQVQQGLDSLIELEQQQAQTNAVIKSTGGIAGITADEVGRLAEKYESLNATVGDEVIREGENLLLTFTNINKKAFEPALATALDMNTALGKGPEGLTATVKVLGKALNDPTKGLSALSRVGVTFTAEQQKRIKALQKEGDLFGAQSIILDELNKRYEGSFLAQGGTTAGRVAKFTDAVEDLQRSLATALLPVVGNVADALSELLQDPEIIRGTETLGRELGKLFSAENVKEGARVVGDVVKAIAAAAPTIGTGLSTAASVIGKVLEAFQKLPPEVQQLAIGALAVNKLTGGLITNVAGGVFGALKAMTVRANIVNVSGAVTGGAGGLGAAGGAGALGKLGTGLSILGGIGVTLAAAVGVLETQQAVSGASTAQAQGVRDTSTVFLGQNPTTEQLLSAMAGVDKGIEDLQGNPLHILVQGDALKTLQQTKADINAKLAATALEVQRRGERTVQSLDQSKQAITARAAEIARETTRGAAQTQASLRSTAAATQAAIRASRPSVTVNVAVSATTVEKRTIINNRYGPSGGSRSRGTGFGIDHR